MIGIILGLLIFIVPTVTTFILRYKEHRYRYVKAYGYKLDPLVSAGDAQLVTWFVGAICAVLGIAVAYAYLIFFGCLPHYSEGERIGYVTKASTKGFLFKTNEVEMQLGTGSQASLQPAQDFSVPDEVLFRTLQTYLGEKVTARYQQWFFQPWTHGKSGYEIVSIEMDGITFDANELSKPKAEKAAK